jgi:hypothetical protein
VKAMTRWFPWALAASLLATLGASGVQAQSITSIRGLGYPLLPTDARTDALGGLGIGLKGLAAPLTDPASAADVARRGVIVSAVAVEQEVALGDQLDSSGATRLPLIRVLFPVRQLVLTAGYGGFLDQAWAVTRSGQQSTGSSSVGYSDVVVSTGGIGQFQVGVAVPLGNRFAIGGTVGAYTGSQRIDFDRRFEGSSVGNLQPFSESWKWRYTGPMAQIGVRWDPLTILRVGASVTWAGTLSADSVDGPARGTEFDLPLQVAGGASAYLAPGLLAALSGRWSGWSSVGTVPSPTPVSGPDVSGQDTWEIGGGLEWESANQRGTRHFPLRVGAQYRQLPFTFGDGVPTEWYAGGGIGMRLGASPDNPLTQIDFTVQRGERTAPLGGSEGAEELTETAWRFSLALAIFGT